MIPIASPFIALALVFFTIGVWGTYKSGRLKWWNFRFFVLGFICDTVGTSIMVVYVGGLAWTVHAVSGFIAILLMAFNAMWALVVLLRKDEKAIQNFHKLSLPVWFLWLIPFFSPMVYSIFK
jgi:uncharacterized repeat protein (TIGR03987 family)